ncbi:hypothetical protein LDL08_06105 [Nonomuraea glycinis]|uniref:Uncharacterized protein n=1 Tax=Nonomuraea glycinis TaxID=2047744 RepID=A0A918E5G0_9ACTN|nr:hypothetical protein [Nonomuraea glycinis]MCA2175756.1 hypothetical protein [Nonomuraea glycinis]GGP05311.1 hypothetical protein GCM10012278_24310 [Nonomuraea glycinis]
MLKEAWAISALVATALVPSAASQAQDAQVHAISASATSTSLSHCASTSAPCRWMQEDNRRCFYCKQKKGGGWKRQYCEQKNRGPVELECSTAPAPTATNPKRVCEKCVDQKTGRQVSTKCFTGP